MCGLLAPSSGTTILLLLIETLPDFKQYVYAKKDICVS